MRRSRVGWTGVVVPLTALAVMILCAGCADDSIEVIGECALSTGLKAVMWEVSSGGAAGSVKTSLGLLPANASSADVQSAIDRPLGSGDRAGLGEGLKCPSAS
jgi:hypothetical protein